MGYIPRVRNFLVGTTALLEGLWLSIPRHYPRTSSGLHTILPAHHQASCLNRKEMYLILEEKGLPTFQRQLSNSEEHSRRWTTNSSSGKVIIRALSML